jgi:hypothetical protein
MRYLLFGFSPLWHLTQDFSRSGRQFARVPLHFFLVLFGAHKSERAQAKRGRNEGPNISTEAPGQVTGFHGSIIHG